MRAVSQEAQHVEVSLRMIGHQILLSVGDSTSRVLPVESDGNRYRVQFDTEFALDPEAAAIIIDSVVAATQIATDYIVEFELCGTNEVVHSYEVIPSRIGNVVPCRTRPQPKGCYELVVTILLPEVSMAVAEETEPEDYSHVYLLLVLLTVAIVVMLVLVSLLLKRKQKPQSDEDGIQLGLFRFSQPKMELTISEHRIELTSKEADLLHLLSTAINQTVERDEILRVVWEDEGAYVGRTLDVFISKLRKKLEADPNVRIVNVRGIGYKLIIDQ